MNTFTVEKTFTPITTASTRQQLIDEEAQMIKYCIIEEHVSPQVLDLVDSLSPNQDPTEENLLEALAFTSFNAYVRHGII